MNLATDYEVTIYAMASMALLMLMQILIADVVGILAKNTPGTPVKADHDNFLFRVTRTVANTNETIAIFVLATAFCILGSASPTYTGYAACAFVLARGVYAGFYYSNLRVLRSATFAISLVALGALLLVGFLA